MTNLIGQSFGRYQILEQLGEGGMAVVYKAYDTRLEADVAVKVIRTEALPQNAVERALKRFEREAKSLAKLTHPNIVKVTDYGEHDGKPYLVMPYLQGGTLKHLLKGKPMPWQDATRLLLPIARALDFAHRQGMIHRDVKPGNILITLDGEPMLTDFGIAKVIDEDITMDLTGTNAAVGTPEYMSPEQVTAKTVDHRTDIYALGVVYYEMVTGRKPFQADTPMAVLFKHASEPLPNPKQFITQLPEGVEKILIKALAKNPDHRYENMAAMTVALESLLNSEGKQQSVVPKKSKSDTVLVSSEGDVTSKSRNPWLLRLVLIFLGFMVIALTAVLLFYLPSSPFGLFASTEFTATLENPPESTFSSSTTQPESGEITGQVLFQENFDDSSADGFKNKVGLWTIVSETNGNEVYDVDSMDNHSEYPVIEFGESGWHDFIFETRVNIVDYAPTNEAPLTSIIFRGNYKVAFTPYWKGFDLVFDPPWSIVAGRTNVVTQKNKWYLVRIEAKGSQIDVFLDDKLTISETVTRESTGLFGFGTWPKAHVQFDDIVIKPFDK